MLTNENFEIKISESEKEITLDFLVNESLEILNEEIDYFFSNKEQLIDFFVKGIEMEITLPLLQEKFKQIFWSQRDLDMLISKIERRIQKEINRTIFSLEFKFSEFDSDELIESEGFSVVDRQLSTYKLSKSVVNLIDTAWKKSSASLVPKELKKQGNKFKPGKYFLSLLGVSPNELKANTKDKLRRVVAGTLKQNKFEIKQILKKDIIKNLNMLPLSVEPVQQINKEATIVQIA